MHIQTGEDIVIRCPCSDHMQAAIQTTHCRRQFARAFA